MMSNSMSDFWWRSLRWQLALFIVLAMILGTTDLDEQFARALFFEPGHGWIGASSWWTHQFIHKDGQWLIRGVVFAALCVWLASFVDDSLLRWRRAAGFAALSMILAIGMVGTLKHLTNVNCPWDLIPFGGRYPYAHLFAHRPPSAHMGRCFPAAHSSAGYALMTFYFVFRDRNPRWARIGLFLGIVIGLIFGISQQSRGAHFLSHDIWSAMIAWYVPLTLYCFGFKGELWRAVEVPEVLTAATMTVPRSES
jgi:membrane-associated PAP2 superfamily phosphatase